MRTITLTLIVPTGCGFFVVTSVMFFTPQLPPRQRLPYQSLHLGAGDFIAQRGGAGYPHQGLLVALFHTQALGMTATEPVHRVGAILRGGAFQPVERGIPELSCLAEFVQQMQAQIGLRLGIALIGGFNQLEPIFLCYPVGTVAAKVV